MSDFLSGESVLRDTLFDLQAGRQHVAVDAEPAIFADQIHETCSVFHDLVTDNRIVVSELPLDESDFEDAKVSITHPDRVVVMEINGETIRSSELIFSVKKDGSVTLWDRDSGNLTSCQPEELARLLEYPTIKPVPVSEFDPRDAPHPVEYGLEDSEIGDPDILAVPQTDVYTNCAAFFDAALERGRIKALLHGLVSTEVGQTAFDLLIQEELPPEADQRVSEFDRIFNINVKTGNIRLPATPLGSAEIFVDGNDFYFRLMREGVILYAQGSRKDETLPCIPAPVSLRFLNAVFKAAAFATPQH